MTVTYAGFWKRFAAAAIDGIIMTIGGGAIVFVLGVFLPDDPDAVQRMGSSLGLILNWIYFTVMESSPTQATLGKMALGIKVVDLESNRISFAKATGRYFGKAISFFILFIGFIMVAFTNKKQGLHDMMAGCLVIDK